MRIAFLEFLKAIFIFSLVAAGIIYLLSFGRYGSGINSITWCILLYFLITTLVFHYGLLSASSGKPQKFVRYYMGATTLKLFLHVAVLLLYCLFNRNEAVHFIVTFLVIYLFYTVFEVVMAAKQFRK